ncbi:hypothetical protein NA56DRAFT_654562 [Hyaloscypha hepaticicola]|uniref:Uncharacterized protein n=1 Tax=Hyaloscypha hepaticicola TaxID=2082293 RepID=A0A2J6QKH6_9HELO|nr:hypothetical protein NA56DRAFT_654562 [Hyaloscypha hepaticicola]
MAPNHSNRSASGTYPPSSTSAATTQYVGDRSMTFASEWHFKPEGVKMVQQRFDAQLFGRRIEVVYGYNEEDSTFRLRCWPQDAQLVWALFYNILAQIIKDETGEEESDEEEIYEAQWIGDLPEEPPFHSNLIESLDEYRKRTGKDQTEYPKENTQNSSADEGDPGDLFPEQIMNFQSRMVWLQNEDKDLRLTLDLDKVLSDEDMEELEALTGCRLAKVLNEHRIYIGGRSEKDCALALSKLDILRKYKSMKLYNNHVFYSEAEENFELVLKPIVDIKKFYFETTLLETLRLGPKCNYGTLYKADTVRIASYSHEKCSYASVKALKITPAVQPENKDIGLAEWAQFIYCPTGQPSKYYQDLATAKQANLPGSRQNTLVETMIEKANKDASIQRWTQDIPVKAPRPIENALQDLRKPGAVAAISGFPKRNENKPAWDSYTPFDETKPLRNEFKPRQLSDELVNNLSRMALVASSQALALPPPNALQPLAPQASVQNEGHHPSLRGLPCQTKGHSIPKLSPLKQGTSSISTHSSASPAGAVSAPEFFEVLSSPQSTSPIVTPGSVIQVEASNTSNTDSFFSRQPERSLLDDDISVMDFSDPIMQPMSPNTHTTQSPKTSRLDSENLQLLSETETRTFHNTMNQRAPKPKPNPYAGRLPELPQKPSRKNADWAKIIPVIDPIPEFIQEMEENFLYLMQPAQGFRGKVHVQAEFGRILLNSINRKHITPKGATDNTKSSEQLQSIFGSDDFAFFTNVLSTSPGEMPYLLNLTDGKGNGLWDMTEQAAWTVEYDFCFIDRHASHGKSRFRVVIDGENFAMRIEKARPLHDIYVHGTCRHWDIKISATGIESGESLMQKYDSLAQAILSSLHVPENSSTPMLFFQLDEMMAKRFELAGVRVHRISRYKSNDAKSILKISNLHLLDILMFSAPDGTYFKLSPVPADCKPCEKLGEWFEVSISSTHLNGFLEQNEKLVLGEEAKWTPEEISDLDVAKSIYLPALEMLKQMDGVGQYNHNCLDIRRMDAKTQVPQKAKELEPWW